MKHLHKKFGIAARRSSADYALKTGSDLYLKVANDRPDLRADGYWTLSGGKRAITVVMGNEIFKMPGGERGSLSELMREIAVLRALEKRGVPYVPRLTHTGADGDFFGMTRIAGVALSTVSETIPEATQHKLAAEIGYARAEMDAALGDKKLLRLRFNIQTAQEKSFHRGVALYGLPHVQKMLRLIPKSHRAILAEYMRRREGRALTMAHGDFHAGNIMVDPYDFRLTGFVDLARANTERVVEKELDSMWKFLRAHASRAAMTAYAEASKGQAGKYQAGKYDVDCFNALQTVDYWMRDFSKASPVLRKRASDNCAEMIASCCFNW